MSVFRFASDDHKDNDAIGHFAHQLEEAGYNYYGTETLYSGTDGVAMTADIFFGVIHYQRLRHMVSDKFQVSDFVAKHCNIATRLKSRQS
jgi:DNA-directed RNA polymerase beta subunit